VSVLATWAVRSLVATAADPRRCWVLAIAEDLAVVEVAPRVLMVQLALNFIHLRLLLLLLLLLLLWPEQLLYLVLLLVLDLCLIL